MSKIGISHLVIARHGDFNPGRGELNANGQAQSVDLARTLRDKFDPSRLNIFSSPGPLSTETAARIAGTLDLSTRQLAEFSSQDDADTDLAYSDAIDFLATYLGKEDVICVVTSSEFAKGFVPYLGQNALGEPLAPIELGKGKAVAIDMTQPDIEARQI